MALASRVSSAISSIKKKLASGSSSPTMTPAPTFQGPVRPGTNEQTFRQTGTSAPSKAPDITKSVPGSVPAETVSSRKTGGGQAGNRGSSPNMTPAPTFQGPVRPGTNEQTFRQTGVSGGGKLQSQLMTPAPTYQGPVRPGTSEQTFRRTGTSSSALQSSLDPQRLEILKRGGALKSEAQIRGERIQYEQQQKQFSKFGITPQGPQKFLGIKPAYQQLEKSRYQRITERYGTEVQRKEALGTEQILTEQYQRRVENQIKESLKSQSSEAQAREQARIDKKAELEMRSLQNKINRGELSPEQAQAQAATFEAGLSKFAESRGVSVNRQLQQSAASQVRKAEAEYPGFIKENLRSRQLDVNAADFGAPATRGLDQRLANLGLKADKTPVSQDPFRKSVLKGLGLEDQPESPQKTAINLGRGLIRDPLRTGKGVVTGAAVTLVATPLLAAGGGVALGTKALGYALGGAYAYSAGKEILSQETPELREIKAGEIGAELIGFGIGAKATARPALYTTQKGRARIALEKAQDIDRLTFTAEKAPLKKTQFDLTAEVKVRTEDSALSQVLETVAGERVQQRITSIQPGEEPGLITIEGKGKKTSLTGIIEGGKQLAISRTKVLGKEFLVVEKTGKKPGTIEQRVLNQKGKELFKRTIKGENLNLKFLEPQEIEQRLSVGVVEGELPFLRETEIRNLLSQDVGLAQTKQKIFRSVRQPTAVLRQQIKTTREARVTEPYLVKEGDLTFNLETGEQYIEPKSLFVGKTRLKFVNEPVQPKDIEVTAKLPNIRAEIPGRIESLQVSRTFQQAELLFLKKGPKVKEIDLRGPLRGKRGQLALTDQTGRERTESSRELQRLEPTQRIKSEVQSQLREIERLSVGRESKLEIDYARAAKERVTSRARVRGALALLPKNLQAQIPDVSLRNVQVPAVSIRSALKTDLRLAQVQTPKIRTDFAMAPFPTLSPSFNLDFAPSFGFNVPGGGFIPKFDLSGAGGFGGGRGQRPVRDALVYTEDFASKALGLAPVKISRKQAQRLLRKTFTGLEIRRGVIVQ